MLIKASEVLTYEDNVIRVRELFNNPDISFAIVELQGRNKEVIQLVSNSWYFILKGSGKFIISSKEHIVSEGDLVYIPAGTTYFDEGEMTLLSINLPGYNPERVKEM